MRRSTDRILTTHTGSLPRPEDLLAYIRAREAGEAYDEAAFQARLKTAVAACVQRQAQVGIDVVSDGELGKPGFFNYIRHRVAGFEGWNTEGYGILEDVPGYNAWRASLSGGRIGGTPGRPECVGPLKWKDKQALQTDIANLKAAAAGAGVSEAFVPCASVGIVAQRIPNRHYGTYEQYVQAIAEVQREEYRAVADAGLVVQIDAPEMGIDRMRPEFRERPIEDFRKRMDLWVEALNWALEGIDPEQVRFHVCWGNNEAPHMADVPLRDIAGSVLDVHAAAYSIEASNPRHEHEWKLWRDLKLPDGKVLIPGVIDSTTNFVEHPELVAERVLNFARLVGRDRVIAGTDCGFGTSAESATVYPPIVWAKLATLAEGARLASKELWNS